MDNPNPLKNLTLPITLIGMMGSGKSTLGPNLSRELDRDFYDSDHVIEAAEGKSVAQIFQEQGEEAFRALERATISRLIHEKGASAVIATGGGAITVPETAELIFGQSLSVWIDAPVPTLVVRTGRDGTRPLLKKGDPAEILGSLFQKRGAIYARAAVRVENDRITVAELTQRTLRQIEEYLVKQRHNETGHQNSHG